jgi:hypothetical protein
MIRPHKFMNLQCNVINVSSKIISVLQETDIIKYDELYNKLCNSLGDDIKYIFLPSLSFLFLLGKIEYYKEIDSLELIK